MIDTIRKSHFGVIIVSNIPMKASNMFVSTYCPIVYAVRSAHIDMFIFVYVTNKSTNTSAPSKDISVIGTVGKKRTRCIICSYLSKKPSYHFFTFNSAIGCAVGKGRFHFFIGRKSTNESSNDTLGIDIAIHHTICHFHLCEHTVNNVSQKTSSEIVLCKGVPIA